MYCVHTYLAYVAQDPCEISGANTQLVQIPRMVKLCGLCCNTEQHPVLWRWTRQLCLWSSWRWRAWAIIQLSTQSVHRMMKSSPVSMYSMQQIAVEDPGKNLLHNCRVYCYNEDKRDCTSHNSSSVLNADVTYRITRSKKLLSPKLWKKKNKTYIFQVCDINMQW